MSKSGNTSALGWLEEIALKFLLDVPPHCCWNDRHFRQFSQRNMIFGKLPLVVALFFLGLLTRAELNSLPRITPPPRKSSSNNTTICHFFVYIRHFHTLLNHFLLCLITKQIVSHLLWLLSSSKELIFCRLEENLDNHFQATQTQHRKVFGKQTINITLLETKISYHQSALKRVDDLAPFFWGAIWTCSLEGSFLLEFSHVFFVSNSTQTYPKVHPRHRVSGTPSLSRMIKLSAFLKD